MSWEGPDPRRDEDAARHLLSEARSWDREADKLARSNPLFLRKQIRGYRSRAAQLRREAKEAA